MCKEFNAAFQVWKQFTTNAAFLPFCHSLLLVFTGLDGLLCKAPTLPHLNYPPHDIARSLGQLRPPTMAGFKYESETPRASPSHRKVVSPQTNQTVVFHVYPEERWEVFFLCYVDDHQRRISQHHPLLACCFSLQWTLLGLFYEFIFPSQLHSDLNFPKNHFLAILSFSYRTVDSECHGLSQKNLFILFST